MLLNQIFAPIVVTYATREEALDAIKQTNDYNQPRKMMLDVYTAVEKPPGLRPVLVRAPLHCVSCCATFLILFSRNR